jgi:acetyl/propionyl-CoA carboxylase alpha subunit
MRLVRDPAELDQALEAARREAEAAFGDGRVYCERFLERPRHVEVQVLGDREGTLIALGERDCSVQRRHQKVVEEAPAPALAPALAAALAEAALAFARAIGYANAGTVEFLLAGDAFYFLELNGRIQVEHPVTELVTGIDLVRAQIEIATGAGVAHLRPAPSGHAIEARVYAEDPITFLPQTGTIERLVLPAGVRVDIGVAEGDPIGTAYDPLLAKVIAHGATREEALARLDRALSEMRVDGVVTNLAFLRWLVRTPAFRAGEATVALLDEQPPLSPPTAGVPADPWDGGWRLNLPPVPRHPPLVAERAEAAADTDHRGGPATIAAPMPGVVLRVLVAEGERVHARQPIAILSAMKMETAITAPYAATVTAVHVREGQTVAGGEVLAELDGATERGEP